MRKLALLPLIAFTTTLLAAEEPWQFGALRFGMTPEQARAAMPDAAWTVLEAAQRSGRIAEIRGASVLELGGFRYDLKLGSTYGGSHHWQILSNAAAGSAAECESRTVALIVELEKRFGAFDIPAEPIGTEEVVSVGQSSRMKTDAASVRLRGIPRTQALKDGAARYYVRAKHLAEHADDLEIMVLTNFDAARGSECDIEVRLDGQTPPPPNLDIRFDSARVLARPSIAYRNRSLRDLGVPARPLEFRVPCNIRASDGKVGTCIEGPSNQDIDPYRRLASHWALKYQLDIGQGDPEERTLYPLEIPVTLSAADVREVDLTQGRVLDGAQLKVVRGGRVDPTDYFPSDPALRHTAADLAIRCQVQEDGSMICGLKPGSTSPAEAFTQAAIRYMENLEIEPTLREGTSAVGGLIDRRMRFTPAP